MFIATRRSYRIHMFYTFEATVSLTFAVFSAKTPQLNYDIAIMSLRSFLGR